MRRRFLFLLVITAVILGFGSAARAATPDDNHGQDKGQGQAVAADAQADHGNSQADDHANENADKSGQPANDNQAANPTAGGALTGSVKVDDVDLADLPSNTPHLDCSLKVAVQNPSDQPLQVTFEAQPPTTRAGDNQVLFSTVVPAGQQATDDVDLTPALQGITPQPQQGFHVKLTVTPVDSPDNPAKHKVFWLQACPQQVVVQPPSISGSANQGPPPAVIPTQVLGERFTQPPAAAPQDELAFTGSPFSQAVAFGLIAAGLLLFMAVRRPVPALLPIRR